MLPKWLTNQLKVILVRLEQLKDWVKGFYR